MAGSKSLELYLPQKDSNALQEFTSVMEVVPPKRLHDAMGLLNDMFKKLGSIIYSTSSFGRKLESSELNFMKEKRGENDIGKFLQYSDDFLDDSTKKAADIRKSIEGLKKHGN